MKATVVEIKDGFVALLREDGIILKIRDDNFNIGDVVIVREKSNKRKMLYSFAMAAAAVFIMLLGTGVYTYFTPYYYVSLDVNPAIVLEVNTFERVIGFEATNEDAIDAFTNLNLRNKNIENAVSLAVDRIWELGYLNLESSNILIATSAKVEDKATQLAVKLQQTAEAEVVKKGSSAEVSSGAVGYEMVQKAKDTGITPGKYNVIVNVLKEDVDKYKEASIAEIMKESALSNRPETPGVPPEQSNRPEMPGAPEQSNRPEMPGAPEQSNRPETPGVPPEQSNRPETPGAPEQSNRPETPGVPPEQSNRPETPGEPEQSNRPETSGVPPEQSNRPETSGVPPEQSNRPETPGAPEQSNRPETPGAPEQSNRPENPGEPELANRPETPGAPEQSNRPETPGEPEQSNRPSPPSNPNAKNNPK